MAFSATVLSLSNASFSFFLPFLLFSFHVQAISTDNYIYTSCTDTTTYTAGGVFENNMHILFSTLINEASSAGFAKASVGQGLTAYGLVQCRGDVGLDVCMACLKTSTQQIANTDCQYKANAIIWYEKCQLRYSYTNFFGLLDDNGFAKPGNNQVDDPDHFYEKSDTLLMNLASSATTGPSSLMFATGKIRYNDLDTIYGLVQCTRDTSLGDCFKCLKLTIFGIPATCEKANSCEIVTGSCRVRFDTTLFYQNPATPTPSSPSSDASNITSEKSNHPSATSVTLIPIKITIALTSTWLLMMQSWI